MRKILSIMRQDFRMALRDNIVVYIIIGPVLLALAVRMVLPSLAATGLTFAVDRSAGGQVISALRDYGHVELFDGRKQVEQRVQRVDTVPGIVNESGRIVMLLEGNEAASVVEEYQTVLHRVVQGGPSLEIREVNLGAGAGRSLLHEVITVMIIMLGFFMGGVVSGFNTVDERETKAVYSLSVSPLKTHELIVARGLLSTALGAGIVVACSLVMVGLSTSYLGLLLVMLCSSAIAALVYLALGCLASNQIGAIAVIKMIMPVYLTLPLVSIVIPEHYRFFFYPLPNYWQFQALRGVYSGEGGIAALWLPSGLALATGAMALVAMSRLFRRRLGLR